MIRSSLSKRWPAALVLCLGGCGILSEEEEKAIWPTPELGMVVSEHPLATQAGLTILEAGGNAADAAVATALALAVCYPQAGNLGGGGFAVWSPHDPREEGLFFNFRETAPAALVPELFLGEDGEVVPERSLRGHLASGVPGSPAGLWELQRRCGRLPFTTVAAPAIELAREGFPVDAWLALALIKPGLRARLQANPAASEVFYPEGEPLAIGELWRQPELANSLEAIARGGAAVFYDGWIGAALVAESERGGGVLSRQDLLDYEVEVGPPLRGWFRGLEILTAPPPSSGGLVLLQVLAILDGFPLDEERRSTLDARAAVARAEGQESEVGDAGLSSRALHWWIEAMRRSFADRAEHMGDPNFHDVPIVELLSPQWIAERRTSIGEFATPAVEPMPLVSDGGGETTHLSVVDRDGNAVSLTTTLNTTFGSGVWVPEAGFLLNNEMDDFSIKPGTPNTYGLIGGGANQLAPRKRPLSSMTPTVVRDGGQAVRLVLGSPGGPRIITSVIQVLLRHEVYGQDLREAVSAPRLHQQFAPQRTRIEQGFDADLLKGLEGRGHELEPSPLRFGSVQAIRVPLGGVPYGASDPRRGGAVGLEGAGVQSPALPPPD